VKPDTLDGDFHESDVLDTIPDTVTWNGVTASFRPTQAFLPGAAYRVLLTAGATSETGRRVLSEYRFGFTVSRPRLAYLAPADSAPLNIYVIDPSSLASAKQITFSQSGVFDFDVSPDGTQIAFSERKSDTGTSEIKMINLETGALTQLTNCGDADCRNAVWRPDGMAIAYERAESTSALTGANSLGASRIWLLDLSASPPSTRPLFTDTQVLGYGLQWSADSSRASLYEVSSQSILVHDFIKNTDTLVPAPYGGAGTLSPDGTKVVFPSVALMNNGQAHSYLQLADLARNNVVNLSSPDDPMDVDTAAWSPNSRILAIGRKGVDERTRQIYLLDPLNGQIQPIIDDAHYTNNFFYWDPTGLQLVTERFQVTTDSGQVNQSGRPELWVYDSSRKQVYFVVRNAFYPRWVP
jgi:Tol biopolymer transport system component